jgi:hypothetical protein
MGPNEGDSPLNPQNQAICERIWAWFKIGKRTIRQRPEFTSNDGCGRCYCTEHGIGIDQRLGSPVHPLAAIMLEEILHWVTTSDDPQTSADFSPQFWDRIVGYVADASTPEEATHWAADAMTAAAMDEAHHKRAFQSGLIHRLWQLIDEGPSSPALLKN